MHGAAAKTALTSFARARTMSEPSTLLYTIWGGLPTPKFPQWLSNKGCLPSPCFLIEEHISHLQF